jgi:hypothetical protein
MSWGGTVGAILFANPVCQIGLPTPDVLRSNLYYCSMVSTSRQIERQVNAVKTVQYLSCKKYRSVYAILHYSLLCVFELCCNKAHNLGMIVHYCDCCVWLTTMFLCVTTTPRSPESDQQTTFTRLRWMPLGAESPKVATGGGIPPC